MPQSEQKLTFAFYSPIIATVDPQRETGALLIAACIIAAIAAGRTDPPFAEAHGHNSGVGGSCEDRATGTAARVNTAMLDTDLLASVAQQLMIGGDVEVNGKRLRVRRTSSSRLRIINFTMNGREYDAIEQNPEKPSRWGQLARDGHQVVQFKNAETNRFVAVAVDGKVRVYGAART